MKQKTQPVISSFDVVVESKWKLKHIYILLIVFLLALFIAGIIFFGFNKNNNTQARILGVCSTGRGEQLVRRASQEFNEVDNYQLAMTTVKITELPKYQDDPDCLFVVTLNYVNSYQVNSAQKSLSEFNKLYNGHNLIDVLSKDQSSESLSSRVAHLTKNAKKINVEAIP